MDNKAIRDFCNKHNLIWSILPFKITTMLKLYYQSDEEKIKYYLRREMYTLSYANKKEDFYETLSEYERREYILSQIRIQDKYLMRSILIYIKEDYKNDVIKKI